MLGSQEAEALLLLLLPWGTETENTDKGQNCGQLGFQNIQREAECSPKLWLVALGWRNMQAAVADMRDLFGN
jgi:hypothetical protein